MMSDNSVVGSASFGVLVTKLCTDFESWHWWDIDVFDVECTLFECSYTWCGYIYRNTLSLWWCYILYSEILIEVIIIFYFRVQIPKLF